MGNLLTSNLVQRKTRSLVSIFAVALEIALVLVLVGISKGTLNEVADRLTNVGADIIVLPPGSSPILTLNSVTVPMAFKDKLEKISSISAVSPVLTWTTKRIKGQIILIFGIEKESFASVGGKFEYVEGRPLGKGYELVIDERLAEANGFNIGNKIKLLNHEFNIVGICKAGVGVRIFMPLATLQDMLGQANKVSIFFVKCDSNQDIQAVSSQIESRFPGFQVHALSAYASVLAESAVGLDEFISVVTFIALIASFLVILLAMYTTIIERTKQIGILKSLGASKTFIIKGIIGESIILCISGILIGYALTFFIKEWLAHSHPMLNVEVTANWLVIAGILGLFGGGLGSIYPAYRAAKQDPVKALLYE